jgi:hypothetical protein
MFKNIIIKAEETYNDQITVLQSDGITPFNLSGYSATGSVRLTYPSPAQLGDFVFVSDWDTTGILYAQIPQNITATFCPDEKVVHHAVYDIYLLPGDGTSIRILEGRATLTPSATRPVPIIAPAT